MPQSTLSYHILKSLGCIQYTPIEQSQLIIAAYINCQQQFPPFIIPTDIIPIILIFYHHIEVPLPQPLTEKEFHTKYTIDQQDSTNPSPNPVWIHSGQACSITNQFEKKPTENDENNDTLTHFQSLFDNKYQNMKITNITFDDDKIESNTPKIWLFELNENDKLFYFDAAQENISDKLKIFDLDCIEPGDKIVNVAKGEFFGMIRLFVKKRLSL